VTLSADRSEAGLTLIELLVTVMVMGIAVVALVGGMGTSIIASDLHRKQAKAEAEVRRYAEAVKAEATCTASCSTAYTATAVDYTPVAGHTAGTPTVRCHAVDFTSSTSPCDTASAGVQVVTLSVSSSDNEVTETIDVVKRPS
jgi:prepilin-type N-terminal cleavage/methylation domain-containing protein